MADYEATILAMTRHGVDLSTRQQAVMILCRKHADDADSRQIKSLARDLRISKPAVTRAADKLCTNGYATRSTFGNDMRTCVLTLTINGRKFQSDLDREAVRRKAA